MLDDRLDGVDHVGQGCLLTDLAVDPGLDRRRRRIELRADGRTERAERVEALGPSPLAVLALEVARRDIVGDRVAEHVVEGIRRLHVLRDPSDHDGQLALVFGLL